MSVRFHRNPQIGLPDTMTFNFQGKLQEFEHPLRGLTIILIDAVLVIYIVLGILYESPLFDIGWPQHVWLSG